MAFVVWPTADANSYSSVADADDYLTYAIHATEWTNSDNATKESALVTATRTIDRKNWKGSPTEDDQPLAWPRTGIEGVADDSLPDDLLAGVYELALALIQNSTAAQSITSTAGLKSLATGSTSITYSESSTSKVSRSALFPPIVQELIGKWLAGRSILAPTASGTDAESQFDDEDRYDRAEGVS